MKDFIYYIAVQATPPSLQDNTGDLDRLRATLSKAIGADTPVEIPLARAATIAARFRQAGFCGTAVLNDLDGRAEVADFVVGSPDVLPAMAIDLGTTHLEATLVDVLSGATLAHANCPNSQIGCGTDILTRIHHATQGRKPAAGTATDKGVLPGLRDLQQRIVGDMNALAVELAAQAALPAHEIRAVSVSGNTTMIHLLLALDPYTICREPYIPLANHVDVFAAGELSLEVHGAAPVWIMPSVGSYFGGDLISGILASGMSSATNTRMLIDVGTNAEVVVGNDQWLIGCAGAAGPALEGGVARMGMRASAGAVDWVRIEPDASGLDYSTIGGAPACGLCGSGLIDLVAALYLARIIDVRGKFREPAEETDPVRASFMQKRLSTHNDQTAFVVVTAEEAQGDEPVLLDQVDIDSIMRSKAAMYSILTTLIHQVGLGFDELEEICIAGAFGGHINPGSAITLGMMPDLDHGVYRVIGNSSLAGAEKVLLDPQARHQCREIVKKITYLELNVNHEFMIRFSGSRIIPHTESSLFPSVPTFSGQG